MHFAYAMACYLIRVQTQVEFCKCGDEI